MRKTNRILVPFLIYGLCSACFTRNMPQQCSTFFSLSTDKQDEVFRTYDLNDQLTIYRCGMNLRPPPRYLAGYIAEKGEPAIPALLDKLKGEQDELTQVSIIRIFQIMAEKGYLRNRPDVISTIRGTIDRMHTQVFKDMASRSYERVVRLTDSR